jgi:peptidyl-prolyl cis-trans isomerase SurA
VSAAAGVAIAVTACGPLQLGAAAIYGKQRITTAKLTAEAASLTAAYQADKKRVRISYGQADIPREALTWMLRFAAREQLATSQGIVVTRDEAQRSLAAIAASVKQGGGGTLAQAAVAAGLPPDLLPELGRFVAVETIEQNRLDHGKPPTTQAQAQALSVLFNHLQCVVAKGMKISVNPQYGAFDYGQYAVVPATSSLAAAAAGSGRKPASPAPQLTPAC